MDGAVVDGGGCNVQAEKEGGCCAVTKAPLFPSAPPCLAAGVAGCGAAAGQRRTDGGQQDSTRPQQARRARRRRTGGRQGRLAGRHRRWTARERRHGRVGFGQRTDSHDGMQPTMRRAASTRRRGTGRGQTGRRETPSRPQRVGYCARDSTGAEDYAASCWQQQQQQQAAPWLAASRARLRLGAPSSGPSTSTRAR